MEMKRILGGEFIQIATNRSSMLTLTSYVI